VINDILDDLVKVSSPRWMEVIGTFNVRGGIHTTISANYETQKNKTKEKK
jgi:7-cyano-7-deazaguanine reductase